jgi:hypothetical protein
LWLLFFFFGSVEATYILRDDVYVQLSKIRGPTAWTPSRLDHAARSPLALSGVPTKTKSSTPQKNPKADPDSKILPALQ